MKKIIYFIVVIGILSLIFGNGDKKGEEDRDENPTPTLSSKRKEEEKGSGNAKKPKQTFEDGISEYESGEYPYITTEDLEKYHANMDGVKVCMVTDVDDIDKEKIQSTIGNGFMMSNFNTKNSYVGKVEDDDIVAIIGTVNGYHDYGAMGKSINFDNCMVVASGEDAEKYRKSKTDKSLEEYFVATKETISSGTEVTEEEYKDLCETLKYKDILRSPDSYEGKMCKVSGKAEQIIEGWLGTLTIYVVDSNGDKWGCTYMYKDGEEHVLEGDSVIVYGECKGTAKVKTLLGKQVILPEVDLEYVEIK